MEVAMNRVLIVLSVIAIWVIACRPQPADTGAGPTGTDTPSVAVMLPAGDVKAGRQAFIDLKCTACHAVPSEADFPPPISANPGPPMDSRLARRDVSYLAAAIVSPSHEISPNISSEVRARLDGVLSPMGDFSHAMTVRQLVDVHAYLRSIE
jgi:Cytochrome c